MTWPPPSPPTRRGTSPASRPSTRIQKATSVKRSRTTPLRRSKTCRRVPQHRSTSAASKDNDQGQGAGMKAIRFDRYGPPEVLHLRDVEMPAVGDNRSEEHTSELQSRGQLVCRLLLEKKKK